jgi:hypothetical protein
MARGGIEPPTPRFSASDGLSKPSAALAGTLHPNEQGHLATAALIAGVLGPGLRLDEAVPTPSSSSSDADQELWVALGIDGAGLSVGGAALYVLGREMRRRGRRRRRAPP